MGNIHNDSLIVNYPFLIMHCSKSTLLLDLFKAYKDARKHKRAKNYQLEFELNLEENLVELRDELFSRTYKPKPSSCFVIHDPKMREVFAAEFRDRIVHHLFYNYTHELFERTFIEDSYSCIKNRGTHYGIKRLEHHIRSVSENYTKPCFVLKLDISGYFMSINRIRLLEISRKTLQKMRFHQSNDEGKIWNEILDFELIDYLLENIVLLNPLENCICKGGKNSWKGLAQNKSLFFAKENCGLPIGNLSSQLFSNVYMNALDQFVKRTLKCKHYGRYVDDSFIVSSSKTELENLIFPIQNFLKNELGLELHPQKTKIENAYWGVQFLGGFLLPYRNYIANSTFKRMQKKLKLLPYRTDVDVENSLQSYLGMLSHYKNFNLLRGSDIPKSPKAL